MSTIQPDPGARIQPVGFLDKVKLFIKKTCDLKRKFRSSPDSRIRRDSRFRLSESGMLRGPRQATARHRTLVSSLFSSKDQKEEQEIVDMDQIHMAAELLHTRLSNISRRASFDEYANSDLDQCSRVGKGKCYH